MLYKLDTNSSLFDFGEWEPGPDSDTDRQGSPGRLTVLELEDRVGNLEKETLNLSN